MKIGLFNAIDVDGVYAHPASTTTEETLLEIVVDDEQIMMAPINVSARNLTVQTVFRLYYKIDGTNYDLKHGTGAIGGTITWNPGDGVWIQFAVNGIFDHDFKVTIQSSGGGEPAPVNVPYTYNGAR
jgi:hypothetical protein